MDFKTPDKKLVTFKVSLSNGETFYEGKEPYDFRPGEPSPIQRLFAYIDRAGLGITSLSLVAAGGREWHLISSAKNPRFQIFADAPKPIDYKIYRKAGLDVLSTSGAGQDFYTVAEAIYPDGQSIQIWVNDDYPHNSYVLRVGGDKQCKCKDCEAF